MLKALPEGPGRAEQSDPLLVRPRPRADTDSRRPLRRGSPKGHSPGAVRRADLPPMHTKPALWAKWRAAELPRLRDTVVGPAPLTPPLGRGALRSSSAQSRASVAGPFSPEGLEVELTVPPHLRKARRPPAPRCDAGAVQAPQVPQQVAIDVEERCGDLGGLKGEVPFERSDTAALEVNPANALSGQDPVAVVRLAVKSLAVEIDTVELDQAAS